ncbi:unnamed protein product [Oreochromis niloticus]|nr:unnamed protein product [Mustela putorius furo]
MKKAMSRTRPWEPKSTKVGTGGPLSSAVSSSSSSSSSSCSPSPSPSPARLAYAGSAPENSEEEEAEEEEQEAEGDNDLTARTLADEESYCSEDQEEEAEEEEQEAEGDNDSTARMLSEEECYYSEDQEDENDGVADDGYVAEEEHDYEMALQLCQDGGSQGESNCREEEEEAGAEPGRGTWELWQEDDAGRAAGGVHDLGRDRRHGAFGETRDADVADDYDDDDDDDDEQEDDEDYEDKDYEEEDDEDYEDKDYEEEEEEEEDNDDDLDPQGQGPTEEAVAAARDEASSFMAYFPPEIEDSVIAMTNLEADRRRPAIDGWKPMGRVEFRAYVGLLVLAGVYRSQGEACESLREPVGRRERQVRVQSRDAAQDLSSLLERAALRRQRDQTSQARRGWPRLRQTGPHQSCVGQVVREAARHVSPGTGGHRRRETGAVQRRGRCPFRQYMPSKPARYRIKICDNFFTLCELADRLFRERGHTVLGTLRSNRPEIPRELRCVKSRAVGSVESVVLGGSAARGEGGGGGGRGPDTIILSYVAKKNKNVLLLTTAPRYHHHHRSGPEPRPSRSSSNSKSSGSSSGGKPGQGREHEVKPKPESE